MAVRVIGTGSYVPDNIITNDYLSTVMDTNDEWIFERTGIRERRISTGEGTTEIAIKAAKEALRSAGIEARDIDLIICATCSPDKFVPSTACEVQSAMGAINATCFDLSAACSGFMYALNTAYGYIQTGMANKALVIGAENLSKIMNWNDRGTCVFFGDGAGAVVLTEATDGGILHSVTGSDGTKGDFLTCKAREMSNLVVKRDAMVDYVKMDGQEVYKFAVTCVPKVIRALLQKAELESSEIKYFILHQANQRIMESVAKRLKVDVERFPMNIEKYGNTSAASIPILLDEMNKAGQLQAKDKIVLVGFGGGFTWGATLIEW